MTAKTYTERDRQTETERDRERETDREGLTDWLNYYYTRTQVKAQMPVEQPVHDKKKKKKIRTLKNDTNLAKNDDDKNDYNYSNHSSI